MEFISDYYPEAKIITPNDGAHYFFGYYDMRATQGSRHLAHRVSFMDRLPGAQDVAQLGYLEAGRFTPFGETTAWNFQQGALLQYHPTQPDTVFYNVMDQARPRTVTHNYATGEKTMTDRAVACVSPDGNWGLAVNFARIYDFRAGYGYAGAVDENPDVAAPENDGIFLTNMESGTSRLLLSYKELARLCGYEDRKILVNHITFSPDSNRYVALIRNFPIPGERGWKTTLLLGDRQGNARVLLNKTYVSHYIWADERFLFAHCSAETPEKKSLYRLDTHTGAAREFDMPLFHRTGETDLHCNTAPGGIYLIGDTYPKDGYRSIEALNLQTGACRTLLREKTVIPTLPDIRCDLHNRYVFGGKYISYDTTRNGCRQIALIDLHGLDF